VRRWVWAAVGAAGTGLAVARPFRVEVSGSSMTPTLRPGDWLVATRGGEIHRGDIVVLRHPHRGLDLVKRITAVPGDRVDDLVLGPNEYRVEGDNPGASTDGREFGPVRREAIEGVVRFRYWPHPGPVR
jgi:nickel-type superoxide dismutase maturation protease